MIYFNGSLYEGGWEADRKHGKGRYVDAISGDIYVGDFIDGKKNGRGRMYYASKPEIYDGEWSNDRRQGEGSILNAQGEISSGEFRADTMEGKLTFERKLSIEETMRVFNLMKKTRDAFISASPDNAIAQV